MIQLQFSINNGPFTPLDKDVVTTIKEDEWVAIRMLGQREDLSNARCFIEDYELTIQDERMLDNQAAVESKPERHFRECFGLATVRVQNGQDELIYRFNVLAKKAKAEQAETWLRYLAHYSPKIIEICFSRTTHQSGNEPFGNASPESVISCAERLIECYIDHRAALAAQHRKRLVQSKLPSWKNPSAAQSYLPHDVLENLDRLEPTTLDCDVVLRGRNYKVQSIDTVTLVESSNVYENQVLVGALYSVRRRLAELANALTNNEKTIGVASDDPEYRHINDVLSRLTSEGMIERCKVAIVQVESLMRYFTSDVGFEFEGEMRPRMTAYVRGSRVYRAVFQHVFNWYDLGEINFDGINFLFKMRSLSKIYELLCLYRQIQALNELGWRVTQSHAHADFEHLVPASLTLEHADAPGVVAKLEYGTRIWSVNQFTKDNALIRVDESDRWEPDFVLHLQNEKQQCYLVLDAKYSTSDHVRAHHLGDIIRKYLLCMGVYKRQLNVATTQEIGGVVALFSAMSYHTHNTMDSYRIHHSMNHTPASAGVMRRHSFLGEIPRYPITTGVHVDENNLDTLKSLFKEFIKLFRKSSNALDASQVSRSANN